jgi:hypothetical protein
VHARDLGCEDDAVKRDLKKKRNAAAELFMMPLDPMKCRSP